MEGESIGETRSQLNVDRKDTEGLSHFHKARPSAGTGLSQQVAENVWALDRWVLGQGGTQERKQREGWNSFQYSEWRSKIPRPR